MGDLQTHQCTDFDEAWLEEAIETLDHYNKDPFTTKFMEKHGLKILPAKKAMHNLIKDKIHAGKHKLKFEDLVEFLDELKPWGKQHIFLYTLKNNEAAYLKELINRSYVIERLSSQGLADRYNNNICRWYSDTPFLAEVNHVVDYDNMCGWLSFKWIETREFEQLVEKTYVTFEERSANFFIINLKDGSAQLRLQSLPSRPIKSIEEEFDVYQQEIGKLIDLHRFSPISLEPVMKQFLFKRILPITVWLIKTRKGYLRGSSVNPPSFIQKRLRWPFQRVTPYEITVYWKFDRKAKNKELLYFSMKSNDNEIKYYSITFNSITDKSKVNFILFTLHEAGGVYSKRKKPSMKDVIGEIPPPPNIKGGVRPWLKHKYEGTPGERVKKAAVEALILPSLALNRVILVTIRDRLKETAVEELLDVPFIVLELLIYLILLIGFYGGDRIRKCFLKIPTQYAAKAIRFVLGQSSEIVINSREYHRWQTGKAIQ